MSVVLDKPTNKPRTAITDPPVVLRPRTPVDRVPLDRGQLDRVPQAPGLLDRVPVGRVPTAPVYEPRITVPVEKPVRVKTRAPSKAAQFVLTKGLVFVLVFGLTYVASTLAGQYLVEKSRTQGIDAAERAKVAIQAEKAIQHQLDMLRSASSIEDWALSHGFHPADGLGQTSKVQTLVATTK